MRKHVFVWLVLLLSVFFCITVCGREPQTDTYKYVAVIGVDGAGAFFKDTDTPCIDEIFANGAVSYDVLTSDPTVSAQCWASLLHGVTPYYHGIDNTIAAEKRFSPRSPFPSAFRAIREQNPDAHLASFVHWTPINYGIVEEGLGIHKVSGLGDAALAQKACQYILESETAPQFMFVVFDDADHVGHDSGFGQSAQLAKITELDAYIGDIYNAYIEKGIAEETLFCVTADHGGNEKNHGGWTDGERFVMFAAAGKNVVKGEIGDMAIRDVAAIVLHALGYEAPTTWTARVPSGLFEGVTASARRYYSPCGSLRYFDSALTPAVDSAYHVQKYIADKPLAFYLPFDGNAMDTMGNATEVCGTVTYADGYFGQGVVLDNGYVSLGEYAVGKESFSFAFWIRTEGLRGSDPCMVSNKDWFTGKNAGFCFALDHNKRLKFNAGDGKNRTDAVLDLPSDFYEGWMHVVLSVDRAQGKVGIAYDFGALTETNIASALLRTAFDATYSLNIGNDGPGKRQPLPAVMDEFMLFDAALTNADIQALQSYYSLPAGDVDGDRETTVKDVILALRALLSETYAARADLDKNGELKLFDVLQLLKKT